MIRTIDNNYHDNDKNVQNKRKKKTAKNDGN